jgi:aspartate 1-decarboxylase
MQPNFLAGKFHRATFTPCELHGEGSCAIDDDLQETTGIAEREQCHIWNINSGARFVTCAMWAQRGSGTTSVNGWAARQGAVGDLIIMAAFGQLPAARVAGFEPQVVFADKSNRIMDALRHSSAGSLKPSFS